MATETVSTITRPAPFIEAEAKIFLDELKKATGQFKDSGSISSFWSSVCCWARTINSRCNR